MALYVHGRTTHRPATEADLANARRRNSELAAELRQLEAISERLQAAITEKRADLEQERDAARKELSKAREQLTKTIKEADTVRHQARQILNAAHYLSTLPEPVHGGREGLEAATTEIIEYEIRKKATGLVVELPKRPATPKAEAEYRHGSKNRYRAGCRCVSCRTWKAADDTRYRKPAAA
jgi:DNA repair exonuclease SbcCD ATPase subunit